MDTDKELEKLEESVAALENAAPESATDLAEASEEERMEEIEKTKKYLSELKELEDESFVKESLRDIIIQGRNIVSIMEREIQSDPRARSVETVAAMFRALNESMGKLLDIEFRKQELNIEQQKADNQSGDNVAGNKNVAFVGSFSELVGMMEKDKAVEAEQDAEVQDADYEEVDSDSKKQLEGGGDDD